MVQELPAKIHHQVCQRIYTVSIGFTPIGSMQGTSQLNRENWQHCQHGIHYNRKAFEKALFEPNDKDYNLVKEKFRGLESTSIN
jgi:hypothetical protein